MDIDCGKELEQAVDVRGFIVSNITPYEGDESFLQGPTQRTQRVWARCKELLQQEFDKGGVLAVDTHTISRIDSHKAGYIEKENEVIVGLQTDEPLKRSIKPYGGVRVVETACEQANAQLDPAVKEIFTRYVKSHNDGVFDAYTPLMRKLRSTGVITGLPDNYARGRIIGDYRRVALYGINFLIGQKQKEKDVCLLGEMTDERIRLREEVSEQIKALELMKVMAAEYGFDLSRPAANATEAVQWTYFAYLAALKEHDGAAMSLGNVSAFFDVFIERDLKAGVLDEMKAQELIDQFVIKLRMVRHLRMDEYNKLFAGDPTWLTEAIGGMFIDGRHKITKTAYRFLQTLYNLGPSPEPNMTILWSKDLPESFRRFAAKVSINTSSLQYENDDLMRDTFGSDDYGISCCVSHLRTGKDMQFFGARCNLAKALLAAINEGKDENQHLPLFDGIGKLGAGALVYDEVVLNFRKCMAQLAKSYVDTMNVIHFMHDRYYYERAQMALLDTFLHRNMAFGIAGLSVVADSLSAIKHAKVTPVRNDEGLAVDFSIEGEFPTFGNNDDRVDHIAQWLVETFQQELEKHRIYKDATPTLSVLTITSNVVYGAKTGATPDGRKAGEPFAPGANPMHGRDIHGAIASLCSVAKLPYEYAKDGISNTFSMVPSTLGATEDEQINNLIALMDGYFTQGAHHLNVNVLRREVLLDAMENPQKYPQLTIRVSGYAVNFIKLTKQQQQEVLRRTFHQFVGDSSV